MTQFQLSPVESLVFNTVTALEARGETPYPATIARAARLPADELHQALHSLTEKNLLHREDPPVDGVDFGPRWCVRQPT
ncbi:MAG TPA: hypothetical protein VF174_14685 [Micromonosporaceae bacterium]